MALIKKAGLYLLWVAAIIGAIALTQWVDRQMHLRVAITWEPFIPAIITSLVSIIPGLLIGLEPLLLEKQKPGIWQLDWLRLLILGIPAIWVTFSFILYFTLAHLSLFGDFLSIFGIDPSSSGGILLGYVLMTSLHKKEIII